MATINNKQFEIEPALEKFIMNELEYLKVLSEKKRILLEVSDKTFGDLLGVKNWMTNQSHVKRNELIKAAGYPRDIADKYDPKVFDYEPTLSFEEVIKELLRSYWETISPTPPQAPPIPPTMSPVNR